MANLDFSKEVLGKKFYLDSPDKVAISLLGKTIVRKIGRSFVCAKIVETEAYFGETDPASRAYGKKFKKYYGHMCGEVGKSFVYMVHNHWMFNVIAHEKNDVGGVLFRAAEPVLGWKIMQKNRPVEKIFDLTNGPGKLSKALGITGDDNSIDMASGDSKIMICNGSEEKFDMETSYRIGVSKDLKDHFRFYVKGNPFVSKSKTFAKIII